MWFASLFFRKEDKPMKRMGWLLVALALLLCGCSGPPPSKYSMAAIDLSMEENLQGYRVPLDGSEWQPVEQAAQLYAKVKAATADAWKVEDEGTVDGAIALYFHPEVKRDFREQYLVFTKENILCASYNPFHNHMEFYQLPDGAYEAVRQAVGE